MLLGLAEGLAERGSRREAVGRGLRHPTFEHDTDGVRHARAAQVGHRSVKMRVIIGRTDSSVLRRKAARPVSNAKTVDARE